MTRLILFIHRVNNFPDDRSHIMQKLTLHITGMACGGCAATIEKALLALDGVIEADVSHTEGTADIRFDPAKVQAEQLKAAIEAAGYQAR